MTGGYVIACTAPAVRITVRVGIQAETRDYEHPFRHPGDCADQSGDRVILPALWQYYFNTHIKAHVFSTGQVVIAIIRIGQNNLAILLSL